MEEALGSSNTAQVLDLLPNNANLNIYTPAYAIYEGENLESCCSTTSLIRVGRVI
jgi:hypothetical protein